MCKYFYNCGLPLFVCQYLYRSTCFRVCSNWYVCSILPRAQSLKRRRRRRRRRRRHKNDNVYDTLATHSALVQNIADRDCWAQNGTSHCHAFVTYTTCVCACMHVCICMHMCACVCTCLHVCKSFCARAHACVCVCVCVCVCNVMIACICSP